MARSVVNDGERAAGRSVGGFHKDGDKILDLGLFDFREARATQDDPGRLPH